MDHPQNLKFRSRHLQHFIIVHIAGFFIRMQCRLREGGEALDILLFRVLAVDRTRQTRPSCPSTTIKQLIVFVIMPIVNFGRLYAAIICQSLIFHLMISFDESYRCASSAWCWSYQQVTCSSHADKCVLLSD